MSRISPDVIKAAVPPLRYYRAVLPTLPAPRGEGWVPGGLCPFHDDRRHGNFRIDTVTGAFTCFACAAKGSDIIAFHMQHRDLGFREALDDLVAEYLSRGSRS